MIVLNLRCSKEHRFEGWFASSAEFERQSCENMVACPACGDTHVIRLPSAPHIQSATTTFAAPVSVPESAEVMEKVPEVVADLVRAIGEMVRNTENVGERFAEEARRIHYQEAPARSIRGRATREETDELLDEGISVLPLPFMPSDEIH
ncbi:MAG: DUF1178 family protein [Rhodocyclaceae bacterium]|nr:DUF1178 family protein [Rhodocyclaceae bacterium]